MYNFKLLVYCLGHQEITDVFILHNKFVHGLFGQEIIYHSLGYYDWC